MSHQPSAWGRGSPLPGKGTSFLYVPKKEQTPIQDIEIDIPGFHYVKDWISSEQQDEIMKFLDSVEWSTELKRRVQHYGYHFDYKTSEISETPIEPIPSVLQPMIKRLKEEFFDGVLPDQLIVNEYIPGQGIGPHTDRTHCFGPTVASISMLSPVVMDFSNCKTLEKRALKLEPCSILVLKDDARYRWTHGIGQRDKDMWQGKEFQRSRRVSLTFRTVILKSQTKS